MEDATKDEALVTAERLQRGLLAWPDLEATYGPTAGGRDGQVFMSFEMKNGDRYYIELGRESS